MKDPYEKLHRLIAEPTPEPKEKVLEEETVEAEGDLRPFYSKYARQSQSKKTLAAHTRQIIAQEAGAVDIIYMKSRFVDDNEHTIGCLERVCKKWKIPHKDLKKMKEFLVGTGRFKEDGRKKYFLDEDLFEALNSCELGKKFCTIKELKCWEDVIVYICNHP